MPTLMDRRLPCCLALLGLVLSACGVQPPISLGKKESLVGQGMVVSVTNTSDEHLHEVLFDVENPAGETKQLSIPTLDPHETVNVGWLKLDGWPIPAGSKVKVSCKGYALPVRLELTP